MNPILSIVIPTKDRYPYLKILLSLFNKFEKWENVEIVIQDNNISNEEFLPFLNSINSLNLVYNHIPNQIPISENADIAVNNSSGKFVCFIGDDDSVVEDIVDVVQWMDKQLIDCVMTASVNYRWPDYHESIGPKLGGSVSYSKFNYDFKKVECVDVLNDIIKKGFINRGSLPLLYHGIVKRDILNKIHEIGGTYFPGPSPDIANGVALALTLDSYVFLDFPIIISGASKSHGGGIRKMKNRAAKIEDVPFLPLNAKQNWEENIPPIWTGETVWSESALKALRYMGRSDLISKVNFEFLYAKFAVFHLSFFSMAFNFSKHKLYFFYYFLLVFSKRYILGFRRILLSYLSFLNKKSLLVSDLESIDEVNLHFKKFSKKFRFSE